MSLKISRADVVSAVRKRFENGKLLKLQIAGDPQNKEIQRETTNGSRSPKMILRGKQFCTLSDLSSNICLIHVQIYVRSMFKYMSDPCSNIC